MLGPGQGFAHLQETDNMRESLHHMLSILNIDWISSAFSGSVVMFVIYQNLNWLYKVYVRGLRGQH